MDFMSENKTNRWSRRNVLKSTGIAAAVGVLGTAALSTAAAERQKEYVTAFEDYTWTKNAVYSKDRYYSFAYDDYWTVGSGLRNKGAALNNDNQWEYGFEIDNYGAVRRHEYNKSPNTGFQVDRIGYQYLELQDEQNVGDGDYIEWANDPARLGGWPAEGTTAAEVGEAAFTALAEEALTGVSSVISGALTAFEIYENILAEVAETNQYPDGHQLAWTYGDGWTGKSHSDTNNYAKYSYTVPPDSTRVHHARGFIAPDGKGFFDGIDWEIQTDAPLLDDGNDQIQMINPDTKGPTVMTIPIDKLDAAGFDVDNLKRANGQPDMGLWTPDVNITATASPILQ